MYVFDQMMPTATACGIVGYVGKDPAVGYLLEGLHILQNRGYDSAGVSTLHTDPKTNDQSIVTTKVCNKR
jgi:glucosamine--fructose-6-phosphate aminotransferase (isomerizing)